MEIAAVDIGGIDRDNYDEAHSEVVDLVRKNMCKRCIRIVGCFANVITEHIVIAHNDLVVEKTREQFLKAICCESDNHIKLNADQVAFCTRFKEEAT